MHMRVCALHAGRWLRANRIRQQADDVPSIDSGLVCCLDTNRSLSLPLRHGMCSSRVIMSTAASSGAATGEAPDLANLRENYVSTGIDEKTLPSEPHVLMDKWVEAACNSKDVSDPLSYNNNPLSY